MYEFRFSDSDAKIAIIFEFATKSVDVLKV